MKKFTYLLLIIIFFNCRSFAQSKHDSHNHKKVPKDNYQKIKISNPSPELMNKLGGIGLDLDCGSQFDSNGDLLIEVSTDEALQINKITPYQVVIEDMQSFYAKRATKNLPQAKANLRAEKLKKTKYNSKSTSLKSTTFGNITHRFEKAEIDWAVPTNFQLGASFGGCLTVDETNAQLDLMRTLYPNLITAKVNASPTNQLTIGGRPLYVVKISNSSITGTKPQTLYTGMTHSREVSSLMNLTYFMWYLLENYATDPDVKNLVDHHDLYFIPIINPDGLAYNQQQAPTGGGMQRKNRRETGTCTTYLDGIDLNRNWGTHWGYDDQGSSPSGCSDTYRGTAGFSEAETTAVRDFFLLHNFKTSLNHHAHKNAVLHGRAAFFHTNNNIANPGVLNGRENEYYQYSHDMTQYSRYAYGSSPNISYWNNGNCNDWMSEGSGKNTLCWTPENGAPDNSEGGFWPTPTQIPTIAKRAVRMNFVAGFYSGVYAKLHDLTKSDINTTSGALSFGLERVGQTDGDFTLTVTPISSNIVSVTNVGTQSGMTVLEQRNLDVSYTLSPSIAAKEKIVFEVTLSNGTYIIYKTRLEKYYNPTNLFTSLENPTTLTSAGWTASGTTSWAVTATDGFGGTAGITTNTTVAYASANTTANLTQTTAISLAGKQQVAIQFNAKWDLERSFDYVQLQGSPDNGITWIAMDGKYTKPGTTASVTDYTTTLTTTSKSAADKLFQPDNQPIYDGDKFGKWVLEEYYISATENSGLFNKASVLFRFILRTDSNNRAHGYNTTFKGFRFDNFKVLEIKSSPPIAICKNATLSLNAAGALTVLPTDVDNGSSDDIGITSITVSPNTFNCTHANTTQAVTLSVTDADGQTTTCVSNVTITVPVATITSVLPNAAISGGTAFTLTVNGTTFVNGQSVIRWNGTNRTTTFVSASQLTTSISAADIASVGTVNITVINTCSTVSTAIQPFSINCSGSTTTWNGTAWSPIPPTNASVAIISGNYSVAANITACSLTVNNNAIATIPSGFNVTLNGAITVSSGSFTLENNANLIQTSNSSNSGNIIVKRNSSALFRLDYSMWCSPVSGSQSLGSFSPLTATNRLYEYNTITNLYNAVPSATAFSLAKGYLIRMPNTWVNYVVSPPSTPLSWTGTFTGIPNNGNISYTMSLAGTGFNAIGNPYPSTILIDNFIGGNTGNINGTLYFWRKRNDATNLTSYSTCTTAGCTVLNSHTYPNVDFISVGQGFLVKATSTTLNFNNSMRVANNQNQFFKTKLIEKNRIWLNLLSDATPVNQMMLAYMTGATMEIDPGIDGAYINDSQTALNSLIGDEEFAVQGRSLLFDGTDIVPLSFKVVNPGNYTIAIDRVDGLFTGNQDIILKDNETGIETDLKTGAYTFAALAGATKTRFSLQYQKTLATNTPLFDENSIVVYKNHKIIFIKSNGTTIESVKLFDIRGRLLFENTKVSANETSIDSSKFANQVLIVQITSNDKKVVTKKIVN